MTPAKRKTLFSRLQAANPDPTTELEHSTPFELLVAVALSAHTTDKSVNGATRKLFPVANTPAKIYALGADGLREYIKTVGLYNGKAKNVIEMCRILLEEHGGEVPDNREALEALPGVGRKTANVILNMVFGHTTIAVDTHIFRVANRTGLAPGSNPRVVEDELNKVVPEEYKKNAHHWLLLHGRYVCVARLPACPKCVIADICEYPDKTPARDLQRSDAPVAHLPIADKIADAIERKVIKTRLPNPEKRLGATGKTGAGGAAKPAAAKVLSKHKARKPQPAVTQARASAKRSARAGRAPSRRG